MKKDLVFLLNLILLYLFGVLTATIAISSKYDTEHIIDRREVTEINDTGTCFEIVLEDGNYYYWKK